MFRSSLQSVFRSGPSASRTGTSFSFLRMTEQGAPTALTLVHRNLRDQRQSALSGHARRGISTMLTGTELSIRLGKVATVQFIAGIQRGDHCETSRFPVHVARER